MGHVIARTVQLQHPESGELVTLLKGQELSDDERTELEEEYNFNNPAIWEDPDNPEDDLASLSDEEFFFTASSTSQIDPEEAERRQRERKEAGTPPGVITFGEGNDGFDEDDYNTWPYNALQKEVKSRQEAGHEIVLEGRDRDSLVAALSEDDARNS